MDINLWHMAAIYQPCLIINEFVPWNNTTYTPYNTIAHGSKETKAGSHKICETCESDQRAAACHM